MRPMLAAKADEDIIKRHLEDSPMLVSPKLDGIRGLVLEGKLVSRSLKPIRNKFVQGILGQWILNGLDGELICGSPTAKDCYRKSSSAFMSFEGEPDFTYYIFDLHDHAGGFLARHKTLVHQEVDDNFEKASIEILGHTYVNSYEEVLEYEQECLAKGYEGIILRHPDMPYKFNRSTAREGGMLKLKRFKDGEARILSMEELQHNANPAESNELGLTKRSHVAENKIPMGTMGNLQVCDLTTDVEFKIGTGFTEAERQEFWNNRFDLQGTIVKYKYLAIGVKDKPRHPVYLGYRHGEDLS